MSTKQPWMKFYPSDWRADPALRMCGLAARGLWMEMLAIMHEASPRGSLMVAGKPVQIEQLANLVGAPANQVADLIDELENAGVFSRKKNGVIYSRRIESDENRARKNRENGKKGGNPSLLNYSENEQSDNPEVKAQIPEARSQKDGEVGTRAQGATLELLESILRDAAGWQNEPAPMLAVTGPVASLIDAGADLELDVIPTIKALAPRAASRTSWKYFLNAIARARDDRIAAAKIVTHPNATRNSQRGPPSKPSRQDAFDILDAVADAAKRRAGGGREDSDEADYVVLPGLRESPA